MAELVLTDARVEINSVNLSDHVRSVTIEYSAEAQEITAMGNGSRARLPGLKDWNASVEFNQDYAASEVDATLFALVGTSVPIKIRPTSAAISATNPEYQGNAILESYTPLGGEIGSALLAPVSFSGNGDLTRATA